MRVRDRLLLLPPLSWACASAMAPATPEARTPPTADYTLPDASPTEPDASSRAGDPARQTVPASDEPRFRCPEEMALVHRAQGPYCIDRYEASLVWKADRKKHWPGNHELEDNAAELVAVSRRGVKPQGYISGEEAGQVCANAGKRLCEIDEWVRACRGPAVTRYPYGNERKAQVCNDRYRKLDRHPVVRLFKAVAAPGTDPVQMWHPRWMNDPRLHEMSHSVAPTGDFEQCTNAYGVYDMVGNLHEWVADPDGSFLGGFFMDTFQNGEGCEYRTRAHPLGYHDYSTGFRCCAAAREAD